jgi:5-(carboxyamino)imidazole ribonucleotide synthase
LATWRSAPQVRQMRPCWQPPSCQLTDQFCEIDWQHGAKTKLTACWLIATLASTKKSDMRLGILGGGQLARMMALAARPLGIDVTVIDPASDAPSRKVADHIVAPLDHRDALDQLARECDVITIELEAVPVDALIHLERRRPVFPSSNFVELTQDRLAEKLALRNLGIATAPINEAATLPAIVKTRRGGYDGRGQRLVESEAELAAALDELPQPIVEGLVNFRRELSIVAAADRAGNIAYWPVATNTHRDGILRMSQPQLDDPQQQQAEAIASLLINRHSIVGVCCIELFDTADGLVANEIAPRVHNSGHWTIEGSTTSQFEQHVRAVCGLPLGVSDLRQPTVVVNLIGTEPSLHDILSIEGTHVHRYEKTARANRKVGHVTITAATRVELQARLARLTATITA